MNLCEALDWCRAHSACVQFSPDNTIVTAMISDTEKVFGSGPTIEEAVTRAATASLLERKPM